MLEDKIKKNLYPGPKNKNIIRVAKFNKMINCGIRAI